MCISSGPKFKAPDPVQDAKTADFSAMKKARKASASMGGGTLLTGPSGIQGSLNTGSTTLLGG